MKHEAFRDDAEGSAAADQPADRERAFVEGELALREGDAATRRSQCCAKPWRIEDGIPYSEPPVWHQPPRQVLGALLLEPAGRRRPKPSIARTCSASARTAGRCSDCGKASTRRGGLTTPGRSAHGSTRRGRARMCRSHPHA